MKTLDDVKTTLKVSGIFDIVSGVVYFVIFVVSLIFTVIVNASIGSSDSNSIIGEIASSVFLALILGILIFLTIVTFILFALSLGIGITSIVASKKDIEAMRKRKGGLIATVVFSIIIAVFFFIGFIVGIVQFANGGDSIAFGLICLVPFIVSLINAIFKIKAIKLIKTIQ